MTPPPTEPSPDPLNPGSKTAIAAGCLCPVLDNGHGRGWMGLPDVFVYNGRCPLHAHRLQPQTQDPKPETKT